MSRLIRCFLFCLAFGSVSFALAADWPQWRGPNRDEISKETGLKKDWSKDSPKLLWTFRETGRGYSGPSIVGDKLYIQGSRGDEADFMICIDVKSGKEIWATKIGTFFDNNWGGGPRGNPTVADGMIYLVGANGEVLCLNAQDGKEVWKVDMVKDLGGKLMSGWGYSESPLVDGEKLIVTPGGNKGTLAALNKKTGEVIWRSKEATDNAGYASVIVAEIGKIRQYITTTDKGVIGVAAKDGKLLWREENKAYRTAVIPTPIVSGNLVFTTSGYGAGCDLIKLTVNGESVKSEKVYSNKNMVNHHGGVLLLDGIVFGYSDGKGWVALDLEKGEPLWEDKSNKTVGKGAITYADGRLYVFGEKDGALAQIEVSKTGYKELGRLALPEKTKLDRKRGQIWTHPIIANGKLYVRDQDLLFCFDVSAAQ